MNVLLRWVLLSALVVFPDVGRAALAPNDYFTNSIMLSDYPAYFSGSIVEATAEFGEPVFGGSPRKSVWWSWTAPTNGAAAVIVSNLVFAPIVKVFRGPALGNLTNVTYGSCCNNSAYATWDTTTGETYHFSVDSYNGVGEFAGKLAFTPFPPIVRPANDDFANRLLLPPMTNMVSPSNIVMVTTATGTDIFATKEIGEPWTGSPSAIGSTVWWSWIAPVRGAAKLRIESPNWIVGSIYQGDSLVSLTQVPVSWDVSILDAREFNFRVLPGQRFEIVTDRITLTSTGQVSIKVSLMPSPANDNFADRITATGNPAVLTGRLEVATVEPGEPSHGAPIEEPQIQSVWWNWSAPTTGNTTLALWSDGIVYPRFAVYKGNTLTGLTLVTNGGGRTLPTNVTFVAQAGVNYSVAVATAARVVIPFSMTIRHGTVPQIAWITPSTDVVRAVGTDVPLEVSASDPDGGIVRVDFYDNDKWLASDSSPPYTAVLTNVPFGTHVILAQALDTDGLATPAKISVEIPQANDRFADRFVITEFPALVRGTNAGATHETSEPLHGGQQGFGSVWWTWTPSVSGTAVVSAAGTDFSLLLGVYTNSSLPNLKTIGASAGPGGFNASAIIQAVSGVPVQIAVDSSAQLGTTFTLTVRPLPPNDQFANRTPVTGDQFTMDGYNHGASAEPGEFGLFNAPSNTVWWTWTAPYSHSVEIDVDNNFQSVVVVYSGSSEIISNLTRGPNISVPLTGTSFVFPAVQGTPYHFSVDGRFGRVGEIQMRGRPSGVPSIKSVSRHGDTLRLTLEGISGRTHQLEISPDLRNWEPRQTVVLPGNLEVGELEIPIPFGDEQSGTAFYRFILLP